MGKMKDYYIEMHSLEWDVFNSVCGECEFIGNCQYYYGNCPHGEEGE